MTGQNCSVGRPPPPSPQFWERAGDHGSWLELSCTAQPLIGPLASASRASRFRSDAAWCPRNNGVSSPACLPGAPGPARPAHAASLSKAVFISIMSFAYYRRSAKCQLSLPRNSLPFLLVVPSALGTVGNRDPGGSILNRFLIQFFIRN